MAVLTLAVTWLMLVAATSAQRSGKTYSTIIVGGGVSGVTAALELERLGDPATLVLEATDRLGGRIRTASFDGEMRDVGSLSVDGLDNVAPSGALHAVDFESYAMRNASGDVTAVADARYEETFEPAMARLRHETADMRRRHKWDASVAQSLHVIGLNVSGRMTKAMLYWESGFEFGVSSRILSLKWKSDVHDDRYWTSSRDGLTGWLRSEFVGKLGNATTVATGKRVAKIKILESGGVVVSTDDGSEYRARAALVATSLAAVDGIEFEPPIPRHQTAARRQILSAPYELVYLKFQEKFWPNKEYILNVGGDVVGHFTIFINQDELIKTNTDSADSKILIGILSGDSAELAATKTIEQVAADARGVLAEMFPGENVPMPSAFMKTNWLSDPLHRGSFAVWPTGYMLDYHGSAAAPLNGSVFFAGDWADRPGMGRVAGAVRSAESAARALYGCSNMQTCRRPSLPGYLRMGCSYRRAVNFEPGAKEDGSCKFDGDGDGDGDGPPGPWSSSADGRFLRVQANLGSAFAAFVAIAYCLRR